jgi:hypothetical protein
MVPAPPKKAVPDATLYSSVTVCGPGARFLMTPCSKGASHTDGEGGGAAGSGGEGGGGEGERVAILSRQ